MAETPALFIGHGSPMNTLEHNGFTRAWRTMGTQFPKPRAVLVVSAHWYLGITAVTAMARPRTIHDFYGFPRELFAFDYPAVGALTVANEIVEAVKPTRCGLDFDQWGLDHGAWSVLAHLYPKADVPVVQLSINALKPPEYHFDLGARLASLRKQGIMILASGNVVHNLGRLQPSMPNAAYDWAKRFDDAVVQQLADNPSDVLRLGEHPDYQAAVPTPDHFIPLLYLAGLAAEGGEVTNPIVRGYAMGSISMTCYGIGTEGFSCETGSDAAGLPQDTSADQTNS